MAIQAKCTNFGNCNKADSQEILNVSETGDLRCPECDRQLLKIRNSAKKRVPIIVPALGALAVLSIAGVILASHHTAPLDATSKSSASVPDPDPGAKQVASANTANPPVVPVPTTANDDPKGPFANDPQDPTTVTNYGVPILTEVVSYGNNSPKLRARRIADRMNDCFLNDLIPPRTVENMRQGYLKNDSTGTKYVFFGYLHQNATHDSADIVATVDAATAAHCNVPPAVLACWWRDILRDWLLIDHGKPPLFTVSYTPVLLDFYNALPADGNTLSNSEHFQKAEDTLINTNDEYERLRLLSITVPPNYVPKAKPDNYCPSLNDDGGPDTSG